MISIIIPTHNRADLLAETLKSLLAQTWPDWEAIVVDDASTDDTVALVQQFAQGESRLRLQVNDRSMGAPVCRNIGTEIARGDYLIYLDSDDCLAPTCLEHRHHAMEANPDLDFGIFLCAFFEQVPGDYAMLWNSQKAIPDLDRWLGWDSPWQTACPIWRRRALASIGPWNEDLPSLQDFDFHIRALLSNLNYRWFDRIDCFWRMPQHATIGSKTFSPTHLHSHDRLFASIADRLRQQDLWNRDRQILMASLYFMLMDAWLLQGNPETATALWQQAQARDLLPEAIYRQGQTYIRGMGWMEGVAINHPLVRRAWRAALRRYWRWQVTWPISQTLGRIRCDQINAAIAFRPSLSMSYAPEPIRHRMALALMASPQPRD
jgi:glycosyltransferase involved in cell wall biosynthesis